MILYDYWRSSSGWRVRIALHHKRIAFERRVVNLIGDGGGEQHGTAFRALNPSRQVPVLVTDEGRAITQSMAIVAYLEEQVPAPPLLPADPWRRARARQLAEIVNAGIQPLQNLSVLDHVQASGLDRDAWASHFIARGLAALEAAAQETAASFLVGDAPSVADVYLVPQVYNARRFTVDLSPFPTLVRIEAACASLPAFVAAHPDAQSDAKPTA